MSSVAMLAGSGAKIGGPWGAVIGAGVGILASIGGAIAGRNEAKEEKRKDTLTKRSEDRKEAVETLQNENTEINKLLSNYTLLNASY
jgi:outer membrane lipoprotein SlyB